MVFTDKQKIIIGNIIYMSTWKRHVTIDEFLQNTTSNRTARDAVFKHIFPAKILNSVKFAILYKIISKTSRFFRADVGNPMTTHVNWYEISQMAELVEQFHNYYASTMKGSKDDFEFLDIVKESVCFMKYNRDHMPPEWFMNEFFIPKEVHNQLLANNNNVPITEQSQFDNNNDRVLAHTVSPISRIPPSELPMSALLAPLRRDNHPSIGYVQVGFFQ